MKNKLGWTAIAFAVVLFVLLCLMPNPPKRVFSPDIVVDKKHVEGYWGQIVILGQPTKSWIHEEYMVKVRNSRGQFRWRMVKRELYLKAEKGCVLD